MTRYRPLWTRAVLAGTVALALPLVALARPGDDMRCDTGTDPDHRMCCEHREHARHRGHDGPDGDHPSLLLRGLDLSDAQREQVRRLMREAAETQQERAAALRRTHDELRELALSPDSSEARLKSLAEASGRGAAELALLRAQTARKVYEVLTPEQRQQLAERRKARMERREERMERREHEDHAPEGSR